MEEHMNQEEEKALVFLVAVVEQDKYTCITVDDKYLATTGALQGDFINKPLDKISPPLEYKYLVEHYGNAISSRKPYKYHKRTKFKGNTVYLKTTLVPGFGDDHPCSHLIGLSEFLEKKSES
jgi:hypothetical protein